MTSWIASGTQTRSDLGLALDLERMARRENQGHEDHRHLIVCTFCGLPALTWTPVYSACDDCLEKQGAMD